MDIHSISQTISQTMTDRLSKEVGTSLDDQIHSSISSQPPNDEQESAQLQEPFERNEDYFVPPTLEQYINKSATPQDLQPFTQSLSPAYFGNTVDTGDPFPDGDFIFVFVLLELNKNNVDKVWRYLDTNILTTVTFDSQSVASPREACVSEQQFEEIPVSGEKVLREIAVQIPLASIRQRAFPGSSILFQLFVQLSEKGDTQSSFDTIDSCAQWEVLQPTSFIHLSATSQVLRPIRCEVSRNLLRDNPGGIFIGSFKLHDSALYHHIPDENTLKHRTVPEVDGSHMAETPSEVESVCVIDRSEFVPEANGARGGRPSHRETKALLMTQEQVKKFLEIRSRWNGVCARQRRDLTTNADFFPFFTINRDETAEYLGVCPTWLKDAIRAQGVLTWPSRPLRKSGAFLQSQKELLETEQAKLLYTPVEHPNHERYRYEIERLRRGIAENMRNRVEIVRKLVTPEYFQVYLEQDGGKFLNPDWDALPPSKPTKDDERVEATFKSEKSSDAELEYVAGPIENM